MKHEYFMPINLKAKRTKKEITDPIKNKTCHKP